MQWLCLLMNQVTVEKTKKSIAMRRDEGLPVTALRACIDYKGNKRVQGEAWIVTGSAWAWEGFICLLYCNLIDLAFSFLCFLCALFSLRGIDGAYLPGVDEKAKAKVTSVTIPHDRAIHFIARQNHNDLRVPNDSFGFLFSFSFLSFVWAFVVVFSPLILCLASLVTPSLARRDVRASSGC
jgi:hypothetical protein